MTGGARPSALPRLAGLLLAAAAARAGTARIADGRETEGEFLSADPKTALFRLPAGEWRIPVENLVALEFDETARGGGDFNLLLRNGDRLRGDVRGAGTTLSIDAGGLGGLSVPLGEVAAVRYGKLVGGTQAAYDEVFARLLRGGADQVLVQRDTKPFPIAARVVEAGETLVRVRLGDQVRDLETRLVYGFVLAPEGEPAPESGLRLRIHLRDGGRITLPLESIDASAVRAGGVAVSRAGISRIEFTGPHLAHLSDFDPVAESGIALFGPAPKARRDEMVHGGPLRMEGRAYARGLGVHGNHRLEYALNRRFSRLFVRCGIDDAAGAQGEATFRVTGDGRTLAEARRRRGEVPAAIDVDISGVERLALETDPGDSPVSDFCDWAEARVYDPKPMDPSPGGGR
jgi:hypothetical protein